jgi:hypothetical protein
VHNDPTSNEFQRNRGTSSHQIPDSKTLEDNLREACRAIEGAFSDPKYGSLGNVLKLIVHDRQHPLNLSNALLNPNSRELVLPLIRQIADMPRVSEEDFLVLVRDDKLKELAYRFVDNQADFNLNDRGESRLSNCANQLSVKHPQLYGISFPASGEEALLLQKHVMNVLIDAAAKLKKGTQRVCRRAG